MAKKNKLDALTIRIFEATSEKGFFYDVYNVGGDESLDEIDSLDGGFCTTTIENAFDMAVDCARNILKNNK